MLENDSFFVFNVVEVIVPMQVLHVRTTAINDFKIILYKFSWVFKDDLFPRLYFTFYLLINYELVQHFVWERYYNICYSISLRAGFLLLLWSTATFLLLFVYRAYKDVSILKNWARNLFLEMEQIGSD